MEIRALILLPTRETGPARPSKQVQLFSQFTYIKSGLVTGGERLQRKQAAMLRKGAGCADRHPGPPARAAQMPANLDLSHVQVLILDESRPQMLDMGFAERHGAPVQRSARNRQQTLLFSATTGGAALRDIIGKGAQRPRAPDAQTASRSWPKGTRQQIITADHDQHKRADRAVAVGQRKTFDKGDHLHQHPRPGRPHLRPPGGQRT
ncbi:hypothetical protein D0O09_32110 [Pseudomonas putida]|nr:hypothetical protein D0O09_32110 [Pseudomonas putida]